MLVHEGLMTDRLRIHKTSSSMAAELSGYYLRNAARFKRWEPLRDPGYSSESNVIARLTELERAMDAGSALSFVFFDRHTGCVVGECNFSNIVRGVFQACHMGFSSDVGYEGRGYMVEGLRASIQYAFNVEKLHRVMANFMPENVRSRNLLRRLGFIEEGYAKAYLKINGAWEDHILSSMVNLDYEVTRRG